MNATAPQQTTSIQVEDIEFKITPLQQAAASCTGAVITSLLVTPLDVVKIRIQAQQKNIPKCFLYCNGLMDHICACTPDDVQKQWFARPGHFKGTTDAFVKIARKEGITSLWSGLSPTLVLAIPATIIYFVAYEQLRLSMKYEYNSKRPVATALEQPYWIPLIAGATARVVSATIVSPLELIRTKMQSQRLSYLEIGAALKTLVRQGGVSGLWLGVVPTLMRDVPFSAIYWMNYEKIKSSLGDGQPSFGVSFVAGAIAGGIAATITTPFDVVKTHQQIELGEKTLYSNTSKTMISSSIDTLQQIFKEYGFRGLFAGLLPRLIKVVPSCAIMISSFEYGKIFFNRLGYSRIEHIKSNKPAV